MFALIQKTPRGRWSWWCAGWHAADQMTLGCALSLLSQIDETPCRLPVPPVDRIQIDGQVEPGLDLDELWLHMVRYRGTLCMTKHRATLSLRREVIHV